MNLTVTELKELGIDTDQLLEETAEDRDYWKRSSQFYRDAYVKEQERRIELAKHQIDTESLISALKVLLTFYDLNLYTSNSRYYLTARGMKAVELTKEVYYTLKEYVYKE